MITPCQRVVRLANRLHASGAVDAQDPVMVLSRGHGETSEALFARERVLPAPHLAHAPRLGVLRLQQAREEVAVDRSKGRLLVGGGVLDDLRQLDGAVAACDEVGRQRIHLLRVDVGGGRRDRPEVGRPDPDAKRVQRGRVALRVREHQGSRGEANGDLAVQAWKAVLEAVGTVGPFERRGRELADEPFHASPERFARRVAGRDEIGDRLAVHPARFLDGLRARPRAQRPGPDQVLDELLLDEVGRGKNDPALRQTEEAAELAA